MIAGENGISIPSKGKLLMADWIVRRFPDGMVEVITDREFPRQEFHDLPEVDATCRALCFIEENFEWGDRILTQEVQ